MLNLFIKVRKQKFDRKFSRLKLRMPSVILKALGKAASLFIGRVVREQMSGRKSDTFGVYVRSGRLRNSWFSDQSRTSATRYTNRVYSTAPYFPTHQLGVTISNAFGKGITARIPKRLHVLEEWDKRIISSQKRHVGGALRKLMKEV